MATIREATPADNDSLVSLLSRCPQGTNLVVCLNRAPDFFARSRPYDQSQTFVAVEGDRIVGAVETALKRVQVNGQEKLCGYHYSLAVDRDFRRSGLAYQLEMACQGYDRKHGADLCYVWVIEDNNPSLGLTKKLGYAEMVRFDVHVFLPYKPQTIPSGVRRAKPEDYPALAALLNQCYREHDLYAPLTAESLAAYIQRLPGFSPEDLYLYEQGGEIRSCLGCWDYSKVIQGSIVRLSSQLQTIAAVVRFLRPLMTLPWVPETGKDWGYCVPVLFGYAKAPADLLPLWRQMNNFTRDRRVNAVMVPLDPGSPFKVITRAGFSIKVGMHSLVNNYTGGPVPAGRLVYGDPCDI